MQPIILHKSSLDTPKLPSPGQKDLITDGHDLIKSLTPAQASRDAQLQPFSLVLDSLVDPERRTQTSAHTDTQAHPPSPIPPHPPEEVKAHVGAPPQPAHESTLAKYQAASADPQKQNWYYMDSTVS